MYFIEKILKIFLKPKKKKIKYTPQDIDTCEHLFIPIDSTGEYLACTKCGKLIKKDEPL
ncbi:MAG: hypothetical protein K6A44_03825 [bacterium]|nr:hypothetical protein [bacterium]